MFTMFQKGMGTIGSIIYLFAAEAVYGMACFLKKQSSFFFYPEKLSPVPTNFKQQNMQVSYIDYKSAYYYDFRRSCDTED